MLLNHFLDRKSTRLNSSHGYISYAVFCLKKKIIKPRLSLSGSQEMPHSSTYLLTSHMVQKLYKLCGFRVGVAYGCLDASFFFFFNDTATTEIYTLSLHDALPI